MRITYEDYRERENYLVEEICLLPSFLQDAI